MPIQRQGVLLKFKPFFFGHRPLALFNCRIKKFFDVTAIETDQMVVVLALIELKYRLSRFKMTAGQNTGLLELGEHAVHGR